ncbi:MAG: SDR family oxidoreductase [Thermoguttaceae bacterium]|nr:SDR family oxidoreductase [Thermoguttaceae bacterium]MDW8078361.1 SDR family oxidoreductase [Thermoguttaceae bacterium]
MAICLVTGGAGFIGSHLVEALVERGHIVRVIDNLSTGKLSNLERVLRNIEFVAGDVCDESLVNDLMHGVDYVFHIAALASVPRSVEAPLESHAACATGTVTILDAARRAGVRRVIYASSSAVYGDQPTAAKRETDLPQPISPYGAAKLAGEIYCLAFYATYGLETVALRYFNVFGPRQDPESPYAAVIPRFITAIVRGSQPTIYGDGRQSRDFTFVGDVVRANLLAMENPAAAGRVFNIATGRAVSLLELLGVLEEILDQEIAPIFAPPRPGDIRHSMADITLARQILGFEPVTSLIEGLRRSIGYYREIACGTRAES